MNREIRRMLEEANQETLDARTEYKRKAAEKQAKIDALVEEATNNAKMIEKKMLKELLSQYEDNLLNKNREEKCLVSIPYFNDNDLIDSGAFGEKGKLVKEFNDTAINSLSKIIFCYYENNDEKEIIPVYFYSLINGGLGHFFYLNNLNGTNLNLVGTLAEIDDFLFDVIHDEYIVNFDLEEDNMLRDTIDLVRELTENLPQLTKNVKRNATLVYREIMDKIVSQYKEKPFADHKLTYCTSIPYYDGVDSDIENNYEKRYTDIDKELIGKYNDYTNDVDDLIHYYVVNDNGKKTLVPTSVKNIISAYKSDKFYFDIADGDDRLLVRINSVIFENEMLDALKREEDKKTKKKG